MADENVPVQRTTFTLRDYSRAVLRAWKALCGGYPSKESVGCLWAQYAHETGKGAFCWNNNIGNVKYSPGHDYMMLRGTWEIVAGKRVVFEPPHRATWFNAYASLDEAMREHLQLLKEKRYASSWPAIEAGLPGEFAVRLKTRGYYTAPVEEYARALRAHHQDYMRSNAYGGALQDIYDAMEDDTQPELANPLSVPPPNAATSPTTYPRPLPEEVTGSGPILHPLSYPTGRGDPPDDAA